MRLLKPILAWILFLLFANSGTVNAQQAPSFPECNFPTGEVVADYDNGTHGVVGDMSTYHGKDTVYRINTDQWLQCLCPVQGDGVQTDWWKIPNLTQDQIKVYQRQGWVYVPTGKIWGLEDQPYLARNSVYYCDSNGVGGGSDGPAGSLLGITNLAPTGTKAQQLRLLLSIASFLAALGLITLWRSHKSRG